MIEIGRENFTSFKRKELTRREMTVQRNPMGQRVIQLVEIDDGRMMDSKQVETKGENVGVILLLEYTGMYESVLIQCQYLMVKRTSTM